MTLELGALAEKDWDESECECDSNRFCNSSSKSSIASFFPLQAPGKHEIHKYGLGQNTYTHAIKLNLNMWMRHSNIE